MLWKWSENSSANREIRPFTLCRYYYILLHGSKEMGMNGHRVAEKGMKKMWYKPADTDNSELMFVRLTERVPCYVRTTAGTFETRTGHTTSYIYCLGFVIFGLDQRRKIPWLNKRWHFMRTYYAIESSERKLGCIHLPHHFLFRPFSHFGQCARKGTEIGCVKQMKKWKKILCLSWEKLLLWMLFVIMNYSTVEIEVTHFFWIPKRNWIEKNGRLLNSLGSNSTGQYRIFPIQKRFISTFPHGLIRFL